MSDGKYLVHSIHELAKSDNCSDTVKNLLRKDPTLIYSLDAKGLTALHVAAFCGSLLICQELYTKGAEVDFKRKDGMTATLIAAMRGDDKHIDCVLDLIKYGKANPNVIGPMGMTVLHFLTMKNRNSAIIELIDDCDAKVNIQTSEGNTILHLAYKQDNLPLVDALIHRGADKFLKNKAGKLPSDMQSKQWGNIQKK